jgi:hypothetical protein
LEDGYRFDSDNIAVIAFRALADGPYGFSFAFNRILMGAADALCANFLSESLAGAAISNSDNEAPIGKDAETINTLFNQSLLFSMAAIRLFR